jgi:hypothetical protein
MFRRSEGMMNIVEIGYGLAYRDDDTIYINRELKSYPDLYSEVILHEFSHKSGPYVFSDLCLDLKPSSFRLIWFSLTHPSTWNSFCPIVKLGGKWYIDYATLFFIGIGLVAGGELCLLMM